MSKRSRCPHVLAIRALILGYITKQEYIDAWNGRALIGRCSMVAFYIDWLGRPRVQRRRIGGRNNG